MASGIIPPNGYVGFGQQTQAVQYGLRAAIGAVKRAVGGKRRTKKRKASSTTRKRGATRKRKAKLVKGSAAAKAYMAKIRKKRKK